MAKAEMTKKWWDKNKSKLVLKTGVGEALAKWEKHCIDPPKMKTPEQFKNAFDTCEELKTAVAKAKSKCGKLQKETAGYCDEYETERKKYLKSLETEQDKRYSKYESDRKELLKFTESAVSAMAQIEQEMSKLEKYLDETESEALKDLNENAGAMIKMYYDQAQPAYNKATKLLEAAKKRYETDGKYIKERRGGTYNAASYGVLPERAAKINSIFEQATSNTNKASALHTDIQDAYENLEGEYKSIVEAFARGKKTSQELEKEAVALGDNVEKLAKLIDDEIYKTSNTLPILERLEKAAQGGSLTADDQKLVAPVFVKLEANEKRVQQIVKQAQNYATKGLKRIPANLHRERVMKPHVDRVRMGLMKAISSSKKFEESMAAARRQAKTIESAKLAV